MLPAMTHRLLLAAGLILVLPAPVRAQFYDLDGAYRCLTVPDSACAQELRDHGAYGIEGQFFQNEEFIYGGSALTEA